MSTRPVVTSHKGVTVTLIESEWIGNGSHRVVVAIASAYPMPSIPPNVMRRVRAVARKADPRPGDVQWTRVDARHAINHGWRLHLTVSRLDRCYR